MTLEANGVYAVLGGHTALAGVSCRVPPGWTAVIGPNGAGKSTLLRVLAGLLPATQGEVRLNGHALTDLPPQERARKLAWLAQQGETSGALTVRQTVELGRIARLGLLGTPGPADHAAVHEAMAVTGCTEWSARALHALSGGERQRVLLARVLATQAPILLLDEPTTHLDAPHQLAVVRLLRGLARQHQVVSVLHELPLAAQADHLLLLREGRLIAQGAPHDPAVQAAVVDLFDGAVRWRQGDDGAPRIELNL